MEIEINLPGEVIVVDIRPNVQLENDSIGSYDFHGYTYYDNRPSYYIVTDITWDKSLHTQEENKIIEEYIQKNYEDLETKILINYDDDGDFY